MRLKNGRWLLGLVIVLWLCIPLPMMKALASQSETWQIEITATGQDLPLANNVSTIDIGVAETAITYPTPTPPPNYTVDLRIKGDLFKDIKQIDAGYKVWNLFVEVGTYADYTLGNYYPHLQWNPADIGAGKLELRQGNTEYGKLLIDDMSTTDTYQTKEADGSYISSVDRAFLQYTIIYVPPGSATTTYYHDKDDDGYGDPNDSIKTAVKPSGYVTGNTDCDDTRAYIYPGRPEVCDGEDNDCDGKIDDGVLITFYFDGDGDGYGDTHVKIEACDPPPHYVTNGIDCNDNNINVNPMRTLSGESLREIEYGRNFFPSLYFSCSPYTSFDLLSDFKKLGITVSLHYTSSHLSSFSSTYWFFGQVSGDKRELPSRPSDNEDQGLYVIDRLP